MSRQTMVSFSRVSATTACSMSESSVGSLMPQRLREPGVLAAVTAAVSDNGGNIDDIRVMSRSADFREVLVDVEVWDLKQLGAVMAQLRAQKSVSRVERVNG